MALSECVKGDPQVGHVKGYKKCPYSHAHQDLKSASIGPYWYQMVELRKARATDTPVCECTSCCLGGVRVAEGLGVRVYRSETR